MNNRFAPVFLVAGSLLSACSGSGGNSAMNPVPFTSFSAVQNNQPVQANGISKTVNATTAGSPLTSGLVTSTIVNGVDTVSSNAQLTYAGIGSGIPPGMTSVNFNSPISNVSWSGSSVSCGPAGTGFCNTSTGNSLGVVINPLDAPPATPALAWNYQSFGYWLVVGSSASTIVGAMSFGSPTPVAGVPAPGTPTATYSGATGGIYVDAGGNVFKYTATSASIVDFTARTVGFLSSGTTVTAVTPLAIPPAGSTLNLTGSFIYTAGSNQFTGTVNAPAFLLPGTATGSFYGPTGQEIGGVYALKGAGPQTMLGAFGGKRP